MKFVLVFLFIVLVVCSVFVIAALGELVHIRLFHNGESTHVVNQRAHMTDGLVLLALITLCILLLFSTQYVPK